VLGIPRSVLPVIAVAVSIKTCSLDTPRFLMSHACAESCAADMFCWGGPALVHLPGMWWLDMGL